MKLLKACNSHCNMDCNYVHCDCNFELQSVMPLHTWQTALMWKKISSLDWALCGRNYLSKLHQAFRLSQKSYYNQKEKSCFI